MAWRVAQARNTLPATTGTWSEAVREAYFLILLANELRKGIHQTAHPGPYVEHAETIIRSLVSDDELQDGFVTFERGCRLITDGKKNDAVGLFRRACERGYLSVGAKQLKEFEAEGFPYHELAPLRAAFLGVRKPELRKNRSKITE